MHLGTVAGATEAAAAAACTVAVVAEVTGAEVEVEAITLREAAVGVEAAVTLMER